MPLDDNQDLRQIVLQAGKLDGEFTPANVWAALHRGGHEISLNRVKTVIEGNSAVFRQTHPDMPGTYVISPAATRTFSEPEPAPATPSEISNVRPSSALDIKQVPETAPATPQPSTTQPTQENLARAIELARAHNGRLDLTDLREELGPVLRAIAAAVRARPDLFWKEGMGNYVLVGGAPTWQAEAPARDLALQALAPASEEASEGQIKQKPNSDLVDGFESLLADTKFSAFADGLAKAIANANFIYDANAEDNVKNFAQRLAFFYYVMQQHESVAWATNRTEETLLEQQVRQRFSKDANKILESILDGMLARKESGSGQEIEIVDNILTNADRELVYAWLESDVTGLASTGSRQIHAYGETNPWLAQVLKLDMKKLMAYASIEAVWFDVLNKPEYINAINSIVADRPGSVELKIIGWLKSAGLLTEIEGIGLSLSAKVLKFYSGLRDEIIAAAESASDLDSVLLQYHFDVESAKEVDVRTVDKLRRFVYEQKPAQTPPEFFRVDWAQVNDENFNIIRDRLYGVTRKGRRKMSAGRGEQAAAPKPPPIQEQPSAAVLARRLQKTDTPPRLEPWTPEQYASAEAQLEKAMAEAGVPRDELNNSEAHPPDEQPAIQAGPGFVLAKPKPAKGVGLEDICAAAMAHGITGGQPEKLEEFATDVYRLLGLQNGVAGQKARLATKYIKEAEGSNAGGGLELLGVQGDIRKIAPLLNGTQWEISPDYLGHVLDEEPEGPDDELAQIVAEQTGLSPEQVAAELGKEPDVDESLPDGDSLAPETDFDPGLKEILENVASAREDSRAKMRLYSKARAAELKHVKDGTPSGSDYHSGPGQTLFKPSGTGTGDANMSQIRFTQCDLALYLTRCNVPKEQRRTALEKLYGQAGAKHPVHDAYVAARKLVGADLAKLAGSGRPDVMARYMPTGAVPAAQAPASSVPAGQALEERARGDATARAAVSPVAQGQPLEARIDAEAAAQLDETSRIDMYSGIIKGLDQLPPKTKYLARVAAAVADSLEELAAARDKRTAAMREYAAKLKAAASKNKEK